MGNLWLNLKVEVDIDGFDTKRFLKYFSYLISSKILYFEKEKSYIFFIIESHRLSPNKRNVWWEKYANSMLCYAQNKT